MKHTNKIKIDFAYVPSRATDVAKTFARIRRQMAEKAQAEKAMPKRVFPLKRRMP